MCGIFGFVPITFFEALHAIHVGIMSAADSKCKRLPCFIASRRLSCCFSSFESETGGGVEGSGGRERKRLSAPGGSRRTKGGEVFGGFLTPGGVGGKTLEAAGGEPKASRARCCPAGPHAGSL